MLCQSSKIEFNDYFQKADIGLLVIKKENDLDIIDDSDEGMIEGGETTIEFANNFMLNKFFNCEMH